LSQSGEIAEAFMRNVYALPDGIDPVDGDMAIYFRDDVGTLEEIRSSDRLFVAIANLVSENIPHGRAPVDVAPSFRGFPADDVLAKYPSYFNFSAMLDDTNALTIKFSNNNQLVIGPLLS
jgi:hypothetical protein